MTIATETQARQNMNRMYRWTRHIYDASRKYYLLGRDILITRIKPADNEHICEIGCGTARNLRKLAQRYPNSYFYGVDASDEMLKTAASALKKFNLSHDVKLKQGFAQSFNPEELFKIKKPFDKLVFSYALSIIPPWRESLDHAVKVLPSGGEIHIIDFGPMHDMPKWAKSFITWWLKQFHVYYKPEIEDYLKRLEFEKKGRLLYRPILKGYCYYAVFKKS